MSLAAGGAIVVNVTIGRDVKRMNLTGLPHPGSGCHLAELKPDSDDEAVGTGTAVPHCGNGP